MKLLGKPVPPKPDDSADWELGRLYHGLGEDDDNWDWIWSRPTTDDDRRKRMH